MTLQDMESLKTLFGHQSLKKKLKKNKQDYREREGLRQWNDFVLK